MTEAVEARGALSVTFYLLVYLLVQEHSALSNIQLQAVIHDCVTQMLGTCKNVPCSYRFQPNLKSQDFQYLLLVRTMLITITFGHSKKTIYELYLIRGLDVISGTSA